MKKYVIICSALMILIFAPETVLACEACEYGDIELTECTDQEADSVYEASAPEEYIAQEAAFSYDTNNPTEYRTTANLRLRRGPSLDAEVIRTVSRGSLVHVYDYRDGEWFAVSVNGERGYMNFEFLVLASNGISETVYIPPADVPLAYAPDNNPREADNPPAPQISVYGVELVYWSEARHNIIRNGVPLHITDVRTGITFWLESFSQGSHADVVPRYQEDTDALRRAFGGRWSWETRPILVTVDGRTFAASMSGMPHGSFNSRNNGVRGHFCMHFQGSRTHNGNRSHERDHQNAVQEAFRAGS